MTDRGNDWVVRISGIHALKSSRRMVVEMLYYDAGARVKLPELRERHAVKDKTGKDILSLSFNEHKERI